MANNEEFKRKAKEAFETIADVSTETYREVEDKARVLAKKTKLRAGIVNDKATVRRLHVELGSICYKMFKDNPPPQHVQLFTDITAALERIAEKEAQIEELKNSGSGSASGSAPSGSSDNSASGGFGSQE